MQVEEPSLLIELFLATVLLLDEHSDWGKRIKRSCTPILKKPDEEDRIIYLDGFDGLPTGWIFALMAELSFILYTSVHFTL